MARIKGMQLRCNRCGRIEFAEFTGTRERDGGYTRWDEFKTPKGWHSTAINSDTVDLCPDCAAVREEIRSRHSKEWEEFMEGK